MATRFCTQCGQQLPENSRFCTNCGTPIPEEPQPQQEYTQPEPQQAYTQPQPQTNPQPEPQPSVNPQPTGPKPTSYLVLAILSTIFCCLPFGIVSIVMASKVDSLWNAGRYMESQDASRKARNWAIAAILTSVVIAILYFVFILLVGASAVGGWRELLEELS